MSPRANRTPSLLVSVMVLLAASCLAEEKPARIPAYLATDPCASNASAEQCAADPGGRCAWRDVGAACPHSARCPAGACVPIDPCSAIGDKTTCVASAGCGWTALTSLCPLGLDCSGGGFCHARATGAPACTCASPIACPLRGACPEAECDCSASPGSDAISPPGGGTCTCACSACAAGEPCQPCACSCAGGGGSATGSQAIACASPGTCACSCRACAPGESCPPCSCACGSEDQPISIGPDDPTTAGSASGGTVVKPSTITPMPPISVLTSVDGGAPCTCPPCPAGETCPSCACPAPPRSPQPVPVDLCAAHLDATACAADSADGCRWIALSAEACGAATPCAARGACQAGAAGSDGGAARPGCVCACPACAPGQTCPPCGCSCCL